jgi:hypothetical protein
MFHRREAHPRPTPPPPCGARGSEGQGRGRDRLRLRRRNAVWMRLAGATRGERYRKRLLIEPQERSPVLVGGAMSITAPT